MFVLCRLRWHSTFCHITNLFAYLLNNILMDNDPNIKFGTKRYILTKLQAFENHVLFWVLIYAFTPSAHTPPIMMLFQKEEYIWKETTIVIILVNSNEIHFNGNNFNKL